MSERGFRTGVGVPRRKSRNLLGKKEKVSLKRRGRCTFRGWGWGDVKGVGKVDPWSMNEMAKMKFERKGSFKRNWRVV